MSAAVQAVNPQRKSDWPLHTFIWSLLLIELLPLYMMIQTSLKSNREFLENPFLPNAIGLWKWDNWVFGFNLVTPYIANTVFVAVTATVCSLFLAVCASYFFARYKMPFSNILWGIFMLLMLLPGVANIVTLFQLLKSFHLLNTLWAIIIVAIAGGQVFNVFILRNFIEEIPKDLFEAAEIDGASHFQQIRHVVIPMSGSILGTLFILAFLGKWNDFMIPLIVLRDSELFTIGVGLVYLDGEYVKDWGKIMAAYFIASIPLIIIFLFTMKLFVKGLSAGAVKG